MEIKELNDVSSKTTKDLQERLDFPKAKLLHQVTSDGCKWHFNLRSCGLGRYLLFNFQYFRVVKSTTSHGKWISKVILSRSRQKISSEEISPALPRVHRGTLQRYVV